MAQENFILTFSCLVVVVIIFFIIFIKSPPPQKPLELVRLKKLRQEIAKTHYKEFIILKRESAIKNYENYLSYQQRRARQQKVRRTGRQARQIFGEAFPEFQNPANRGAFIRGIVLELVRRLYQGHSGLSREYQNKLDELIQDASAAFTIRQELMRWHRAQQEKIRADFEAGNISQEARDDELEQLTSIYNDAMQNIIFS